MTDYQRYSPSYRAIETRQVMDWIRAGQCGCIVGLRGAGKSNFIRFLLRVDTQQRALGPGQSNFIFALVNLLFLTESSEWGVYEMILKNLLAQLHSPNITDEIIQEVKALHLETIRTRDVLVAERAVEHCVDLLCQQASQQVVLFFDEFDAVFRELSASLFRCLRAIRDSHTDQVSYIVVATQDLTALRDDLDEEVEHFYRLVSRNPCWLGPYIEGDALQMTNYLSSRRILDLIDKDAARLLELSGGHAGLLKTILSLVWNDEKISRLATVETFFKQPEVKRECQKIWDSLSANEKAALCSFSNGDRLDDQSLSHLTERGLMRRGKGIVQAMFSPIFASFVKEQAPPSQKGSFVNYSSHIVQLDGKRITDLTELEFDLIYYLYENRKRVCTKPELMDHVYHQRYETTSDEMIHTLVARLRKKIEEDPEYPRYVINARGKGYRFVLSDE